MNFLNQSPHHPEDPWNQKKDVRNPQHSSESHFSLSSIFWILLGFLLPCFGVVIACILKKQEERVLKLTLIGTALSIFLSLLFPALILNGILPFSNL